MTQFDDVLAQLGQRHQSLAVNLVQFAALLKSAGVDVTTTQVRGAAKALLCVDVTQRDDTRIALVSSLVTNHDDFSAFDALFAQFWRVPHDQDDPPRPEPARVGAGGERLGTAELVDAAYARGEGAPVLARETPPQTYSAEEVLLQKDFSTYRGDDLHNARRYLRRLGRKLSSATTRRQRASRKGRDVDLRKSLRLAARRDGEVLRLRHRRRRVRRPNLLLLCDVSGSMDVYSRFLVQFLYGMQHELRGVSTFVFSTRLFEVTAMLRVRSFGDALTRVSQEVHGWSGGTRIGACLAELNRRAGKQRIGPRTVVVIMSDGWDRGDIDEMAREMRAIKRRCYRVLWLNPLLGMSGYRPLAKGMAAALPSIDEFLPVHNLSSLARVGRTLMRLSRF